MWYEINTFSYVEYKNQASSLGFYWLVEPARVELASEGSPTRTPTV